MELGTTREARPRQADATRPDAAAGGFPDSAHSWTDDRGNAAGAAPGKDPLGVRSTVHRLWRRGQHGWPERFPVAQLPNAPLLVAMAGLSASWITEGSANAFARAVFYAGLAAWAWGELSQGANWVRRALGVGTLGYVLIDLGTALAARG